MNKLRILRSQHVNLGIPDDSHSPIKRVTSNMAAVVRGSQDTTDHTESSTVQMNLLYWIMMVFPHVDGDSNSDKQDSEERMQLTAEHGDDGNTREKEEKEEKEKLTVNRIFDALTKKFPLVPAADLRIQAVEISRSAGPGTWNRIVQKISEVCFKSVMYFNMAFHYSCFKSNCFPVSSNVFLV